VHLDYPVAIDSSGRVADGYGVKGEPWFVLADPGAANSAPWNQEVYTEGWPTLGTLEADVRGALKPIRSRLAPRAAARDLAGSPAPLAKLHRQANRLLPGGEYALSERIRALYGYPIVVNIWASWCVPCQKEFDWFGNESAIYGTRVAFLGVDYEEASTSDGADFLAGHRVSYPSYSVGDGSIGNLLPGGVEGTPTTLFIGPDGKVVKVWIGQEPSEQTLAQQIETYALNR
jgi:cytochrome c biogenesis protein CcmG/thiol:disulfide interchange protein DsbE